jgi:hypothetical protein
MVGHQAIREQLDIGSLQCLAKHAFERFIVSVFSEDGSPSIGSIKHVVNMPGDINAGSPTHRITSNRLVKLVSASQRYRTKTTQSTKTVPDTFFLHANPRETLRN